jgi:transcription termination/antitermination protein NusG
MRGLQGIDIPDLASSSYRWFALQTRSRHEKVVQCQLERRNVEHFLPMMKRVSQWTDRKKEIKVPLFAGYCFARFALAERLPVLQSEGVVRVVGSADRPEPIPDEEIDALRRLIINSSNYVCHPYLKEGMLAEVINGPMQGLKGRLIRGVKNARLVLSITLIQRSVSIEINADDVAPVRDNLTNVSTAI